MNGAQKWHLFLKYALEISYLLLRPASLPLAIALNESDSSVVRVTSAETFSEERG